jgi:prefoldin subunit 5
VPRDVELQALERQADYFRGALDEIQKRLQELQAAQAGEKK